MAKKQKTEKKEKKNKQNRPRLKTLIFLCVIIALIIFSVVVGVKLNKKSDAGNTPANLTYQI